jgi:nucleoside-diphosphate-sugar epimerase
MSSVKAINPTDNYGLSKKAAEDLVLSFGKNNNNRLSVSILQPALVYGPSVKGNLLSMLRLIQKGLFLPPPEVHNARSMVALADVITAMLLVVENPMANGKIYILTDEHHYSTKEIYDAMRNALGLSPIRWSFPFIVFKIMAHVGDWAERLLKRRLPFNSEVLEKFFGSAVYSSKRIREELGFQSQHTLFSDLSNIVNLLN